MTYIECRHPRGPLWAWTACVARLLGAVRLLNWLTSAVRFTTGSRTPPSFLETSNEHKPEQGALGKGRLHETGGNHARERRSTREFAWSREGNENSRPRMR